MEIQLEIRRYSETVQRLFCPGWSPPPRVSCPPTPPSQPVLVGRFVDSCFYKTIVVEGWRLGEWVTKQKQKNKPYISGGASTPRAPESSQAPALCATFLYLLSPVDLQQNLAADVAVLSWLWSASPTPQSHRQHSQTTLDLFICAWGEFGAAAVSTPTLPLVLKALGH